MDSEHETFLSPDFFLSFLFFAIGRKMRGVFFFVFLSLKSTEIRSRKTYLAVCFVFL